MASNLIVAGETIPKEWRGYHPESPMARIIGVELRVTINGQGTEELEMLPCNILIPSPRHNPAMLVEMPCTLHTSVGDFNMTVGCNCRPQLR